MSLRKKIYALLCTLCLCPTTKSMEEAAQPNKPKHIIFDLGYFVKPNMYAAGKKLGFGNMLLSGISGKTSEQQTTQELFAILHKVRPPAESPREENKDEDDNSLAQRRPQEVLYWHHNVVPLAMIAWFKSKMQSKELLQASHAVITQDYNRFTRGRMHNVSSMVFDPQQLTDILEPRHDVFKITQKLQRQGHTVHILGNWSTDVKETIQTRFQEDFSRINGNVAVSGDLGAIKCLGNTTIYDKFFANYLPQATADDIVLVEQSDSDQDWQQSLPIQVPQVKTIIAHPNNSNLLKARLMRAGLLPYPKN